jgi:hypothetical protein
MEVRVNCIAPKGAKEGSRGQARSARPPVDKQALEPRQGRKNEHLSPLPGLLSNPLLPGAALAPGYLLMLWGRNFEFHFHLHPPFPLVLAAIQVHH